MSSKWKDKEWVAEYKRQWRLKNKEVIAKKKHEYYMKNKEHCLKVSKDWAKRNPERVREYARKDYRANKDRYSKNRKDYRERHPERTLSYNRTVRKDLRGKACEVCGMINGKIEFHHDDYEQDVGKTLCVPCHRKIHVKNVRNEEVRIHGI